MTCPILLRATREHVHIPDVEGARDGNLPLGDDEHGVCNMWWLEGLRHLQRYWHVLRYDVHPVPGKTRLHVLRRTREI